MGSIENVEMNEIDENYRIDTVDLDVNECGCFGQVEKGMGSGSGGTIDITDILKAFNN